MTNNAHADWFGTIDSSVFHDDNLTYAKFPQDIVSDSGLTIGANGGYFIQLNNRDSLVIKTNISGTDYNKYDGLNNVSLGVGAAFKNKWGLGIYAPWTELSASTSKLEYKEDLRDSWLYQAKFSAGKRITERLSLWMELGFEKRVADETHGHDRVSGAAFDLINRTLGVSGNYIFNENMFLTLGYVYREGDVVSTSLADHPGHNWDSVMTAEADDPTFGHDAEAYRLYGVTHTLGVRLNFPVTNHLLLGVEFQRHITHGRGGNDYYKSVPVANLSYSF
jgi:hypothetical protein